MSPTNRADSAVFARKQHRLLWQESETLECTQSTCIKRTNLFCCFSFFFAPLNTPTWVFSLHALCLVEEECPCWLLLRCCAGGGERRRSNTHTHTERQREGTIGFDALFCPDRSSPRLLVGVKRKALLERNLTSTSMLTLVQFHVLVRHLGDLLCASKSHRFSFFFFCFGRFSLSF
ncbi:hypothetical protein ABB37_00287 [Leptomonas pyrrhocoris]|uniref:Uncharacterized protein n=1 Tax=Leptomonas pyrrhocoris TaxID=157538 RepID=A0A0M9GAB2_LEPPY|nr:hypothetical protein ABB37_00287 [Leptomonas pyrrhocoris]KPA85999.1 hypothetical protein ABB37_00287 [Leptomonas pyrrhocoris]|eukprot:XP_015664438.1 hypothetical protein ABB37_00287 [Leptomonas pyrrhocoris]